jgi:CRISPR-associated protein Cst2
LIDIANNLDKNNDKRSKSLSIGMLMKVDVGNVNAGWTEGVVTIIKKVERPDGFFHPYISGQAIRRYIRDTIGDILNDEINSNLLLSPEEAGQEKKSPVVTKGDPKKYVDDDLFGFMLAIKKERTTKKAKTQQKEPIETTQEEPIETTQEEPIETTQEEPIETNEEKDVKVVGTRKRTSPLRVSPSFGIFKLNSDRDLGTRSAIGVTKSADAGGSIFETEITNNMFRSSLLLELDRVGVWKGYETTDEKDKIGGQLSEEARKSRIVVLLKSLKYIWGGGRQSRFLVDLIPQFIIYARMKRKIPLFLNSLDVEYTTEGYRIKTDIIKETIADYSNDIHSIIIGIRTGKFVNSSKEFTELYPNVELMTIGNAIDSMMKDIQTCQLI